MSISREDLLLYLLGELDDPEAARSAARRLAERPREREALERAVRPPGGLPAPPRRDAEYGRRVWLRLAPRLDGFARRRRLRVAAVRVAVPVALVAAAALLAPPPAAPPAVFEADPRAGHGPTQRSFDHLDRVERLLRDVANAPPESTLSAEAAAAEELLAWNRLHRQLAEDRGRPGEAALLEDVEVVLLELAHVEGAPGAARRALQGRLEGGALLFRLHVTLRLAAAPPPADVRAPREET